jgi:phenylpyruvate tautomerase PptA (4-oxalocrotonate tautomerase family)
MPLVRISLRRDVPAATRRAISDAIQQAMVETINVPPDDRFHVLSEHDGDSLLYDPGYLGIRRDDGFLIIQITLAFGRSEAKKKALYRRIADLVSEHGVRQENIFVSLVEVAKENWSFGNGRAQYADAPPAHLVTTAAAD